MKGANNILALLIVASIAIIGIAVIIFVPSIVNNFSDFSDAIGFAAHPIYPSFSTAENGFTISGNTLSVSDNAIYRIGYYSINGGAWQNFTLSGTTLSGSWLTGTATYTLPTFGTGESYVVIYSCTKTNTVWNCHDGTIGRWQLKIINNTGAVAWNTELLTNNGFESGDFTGWTVVTGTGNGFVVGFNITNLSNDISATPQNGKYLVYNKGKTTKTGVDYYIYQDVDLNNYRTYIDAGNVVVNASGFWVSSEYGDYGTDYARIQIMFLDTAKNLIQTGLDTGYVSNTNDIWSKSGITQYAVPPNTRYIRMWATNYENCSTRYCDAGSLDSFSVKLGYSTSPICTSHASSSCYNGNVYWYDSCNVREEIQTSCTNTQTCSGGRCIDAQPAPTCSDGIRNQGELGIDCGGPCPACQTSSGTTYYISTTGSNGKDGKTPATAWRTLKYACDNVQGYGATIHVTAGEYLETEECQLAVGVNIEGEGPSSIIRSQYKSSRYGDITHASISLISSSENTPGNQNVHDFVLDGYGEQGSIGMVVKRRGNVQIYDMIIKDFFINGISFLGAGQHETPAYFATGNKLFNSVITNCGDAETDPDWNGGGLIETDGQDGLEIYNNVLTENSRPQGHNGNIINGHVGKGERFYNNVCTKPDYDGDTWNFHIENWNSLGGYEIYNNTFYGGDTAIDVGGDYNLKGGYPYSMYIHDNFFTGPHAKTNGGEYAICLEGTSTNDVWIYRNHFLNYPEAVQVCDGFDWATQQKGIYFGYNILEKSGWNDGVTYGNIMEFLNSYPTSSISDVYIYNNVILGNDLKHTTAIKIAVSGALSNFNVKNNIIMHNYNGGYINIASSGRIDGLNIDHNIIYDNWNNNNPVGNNYVFPNNLNVDPSFVNENSGNFHLQPASLAKDAGINVGLTSDYAGTPVPQGTAPDVGAYEYR